MHDLEQRIAEWRRAMATAPGLSPETLDELESHLRDGVAQLRRSGLTESDAFDRAAAQLGMASAIGSEFRKLDRATWLPVKLAFAAGAVAILGYGVLAANLGATRPSGLLLAAHVFTVALGYTTTFLVGALGVCFVGQRCVSEVSSERLRGVTQVTFRFGCLAAGLTALGVLLGMVWAKANLGRFWAWDMKETGAIAILLWQGTFLLAHRLASVTARGILTLGLLGNIVVSVGWFGGNMLSGSSPGPAVQLWLLLLAAVIGNAAFFALGFAPAGWLRFRKS